MTTWQIQNGQQQLMQRRAQTQRLKKNEGTIAQKTSALVQKIKVQQKPAEQIIEKKAGVSERPYRLSQLNSQHRLMNTAIKTCQKWAQQKKNGNAQASMILCGPVGTGKTHIANSLLWSMPSTLDDGTLVGYRGRFFTASDLIMMLSPTKGEDGQTETATPLSFIGAAPIVVIDDIGTERNIPFVKGDQQQAEIQARYYRIIDYCYQRLSLVITSNLSIKQLEAHLGERSWDRLEEMAPKGFMLDLTGVPSWRKKRSGRTN